MANNYLLTPNAKIDLQEIWNYTFEAWGEQQADEYIFEFFNRFEWLGNRTLVGKHRPEIKADYYSYLQAEHVIFYEIINDGVAVIGIPHQAMDIDNFFES